MRPDIVPGGVFPDYKLSDHRGMHRTLSELQEADALVLVLSRGVSVQKKGDNTRGSCSCITRCKWGTAASPESPGTGRRNS